MTLHLAEMKDTGIKDPTQKLEFLLAHTEASEVLVDSYHFIRLLKRDRTRLLTQIDELTERLAGTSNKSTRQFVRKLLDQVAQLEAELQAAKMENKK